MKRPIHSYYLIATFDSSELSELNVAFFYLLKGSKKGTISNIFIIIIFQTTCIIFIFW